MELDQHVTPLQRAFRQSVDPFGVMESCLQVQQAWLQHPRELAEKFERLSHGMWQVYNCSWRRVTGSNERNGCPAATYDERFQDRIWEENSFLASIRESYLMGTRWLMDAVHDTPGVSDKT